LMTNKFAISTAIWYILISIITIFITSN
jgi:hypothetical protein